MYQQYPRYREAGTSLVEVMITAVIFVIALAGLGKIIMYGYQENIRQSQLQSDIFSNYTNFINQAGPFTNVTIPVAINGSVVSVTISTVSGNITNDNVYQTEPSA